MSVASLGVSDIDRWVARLRKAGFGESSIRYQHTALRAALQLAVLWEWIATNPERRPASSRCSAIVIGGFHDSTITRPATGSTVTRSPSPSNVVAPGAPMTAGRPSSRDMIAA